MRGHALGGLGLFTGKLPRLGGSALIDQFVVSATNFASGVVVGRLCATDELGLYMLGLSVLYFVIDSQTALISQPYMVHAPRLQGLDLKRYTGSSTVHQVFLASVMALALAIGAPIASRVGGAAGAAAAIHAVAVSMVFILFREFVRRVSFASLDFRSALSLDSCVAAVQLVSLGILVHFKILSAPTAIGAMGASCCVASIVWVVRLRNTVRFHAPQVVPDLRQNWAFGKWIAASGILWALTINLYPWVLTVLHDASSTGVWAACFGVVAMGNPLFLGLQNLYGPRLAHSYAEGGAVTLRAEVRRVSMALGAFAAPFCVVLVAFGGLIVEGLYGGQYAGHGGVVALLSMNWLISAVGFAFSRGLFIIGRADVEFRTNILNLMTLALVGVWLVKALGPLGVALSILLGNLVVSALKFVWFERHMARSTAHERSRNRTEV